MLSRFPAVVPLHLYKSVKQQGESGKVGLVEFSDTFEYPLHPVGDLDIKGVILIVDDLWQLDKTYCEVEGPPEFSIFMKKLNIKAR